MNTNSFLSIKCTMVDFFYKSLTPCSLCCSHRYTFPGYSVRKLKLWVVMIIAEPCWQIWCSNSTILLPVSISRFPVGSSAMMISGLLRMALAMTIRCCSPHDNSLGILYPLLLIPTNSRTSCIRLRMSVLFFHPVAWSTNSRFSYTERSVNSWKS